MESAGQGRRVEGHGTVCGSSSAPSALQRLWAGMWVGCLCSVSPVLAAVHVAGCDLKQKIPSPLHHLTGVWKGGHGLLQAPP